MLSRAQTEALWGATRTFPADDQSGQIRHTFDLVVLNLRQDTGEVMLTRDQFAEEIGYSAYHVSHVMGTLERMGVIRRERRCIGGIRGPDMAVYPVNPHVDRNGSLHVCKAEASEGKPPLLTVIEGGKP